MVKKMMLLLFVVMMVFSVCVSSEDNADDVEKSTEISPEFLVVVEELKTEVSTDAEEVATAAVTESEIMTDIEEETIFPVEPETDVYEDVGTGEPKEKIEISTEITTEEAMSETEVASEITTEIESTEPTEDGGAIYTYSYIFSGNEGENINILVYGKNLADTGKYVFEIDYSAYSEHIEILDLCALTWEKETGTGVSQNEQIEIMNIDNGKIQFRVLNNRKDEIMWSGLLNIIKFTKLTENNVNITLNVYE